MTSSKEILIAARKKIEKPENWTQGQAARNKFQHWCDPTYAFATCWCALGAIRSVVGRDLESDTFFVSAYKELVKVSEDRLIARFNDSHTHEEVLALFDRAIANAD